MPSSVTLEAKMTKIVYCCSIALLTGCMIINARTAHTGHLIVSLTDSETGGPITNAMVTVRTQTKFSLGGHGSPDSFYTNTSSCSDSNGIAHIEFQFYDSDFGGYRVRQEATGSDMVTTVNYHSSGSL